MRKSRLLSGVAILMAVAGSFLLSPGTTAQAAPKLVFKAVSVGFVERVWIQAGRVVRSSATITLDDRPIRIVRSTLWQIPLFRRRAEARYRPY